MNFESEARKPSEREKMNSAPESPSDRNLASPGGIPGRVAPLQFTQNRPLGDREAVRAWVNLAPHVKHCLTRDPAYRDPRAGWEWCGNRLPHDLHRYGEGAGRMRCVGVCATCGGGVA